MKKKGSKGEEQARKFLKKRGYKILDKNFYCYRGEIDIIALDLNYVVFVEVKKRTNRSFVSPQKSLTRKKRKRIIKCAERWIKKNNYKGDVRFDFVGISEGDIQLYKDAFRTEEGFEYYDF